MKTLLAVAFILLLAGCSGTPTIPLGDLGCGCVNMEGLAELAGIEIGDPLDTTEPRCVEVAVEADFRFWQFHGPRTEQVIRDTFTEVDAIYQSELNMEVRVVSIEILHSLPFHPVHLSLENSGLDHARNARGNLVLQLKNIGKPAVVTIRPNVAVRGGVDELRSDANPFTCLADVAFEHIANTEFSADVLDLW